MSPQRVPAGIRFKEAGKIYYFDAGGFDLSVGTFVVVDTSHGKEVGRVVVSPDQVLASEIKDSLKPILRLADHEDLERSKELKKRAQEQLAVAKKRVIDEELELRVVAADYSLDESQLSFYFTADDRVDFRSLAKELSEEMDTRVQLLQIGERDRAKLIDGIGRCGERLCCSSWMSNFPTVSIRQAKEQDLPLNPSKLSGACGRLLCCLTYEYDQYREIKGGLPKVGSRISTPTGDARVLKINVPKETISLSIEGSQEPVEVPLVEFRLMYGTAMRPKELTENFEKDLMAKDISKSASGRSPTAMPPPRPQQQQPSQTPRPQQQQGQRDKTGTPPASGDERPKRRRRRGGRNRRRRGGGGQGRGGQGGGGGGQSSGGGGGQGGGSRGSGGGQSGGGNS
jgi:cell fate regulator YaaT (PSP1 superfamily)